MYYHYALAGKWRPLPPRFEKLRKAGLLTRLVPHDNKKPRPKLATEPEAATGIAIEGKMPPRFIFSIQYWPGPTKESGEWKFPVCRRQFAVKLFTKQVKDNGKYAYHYIGTTRVWQDSLIMTFGIRDGSGVMTGVLYDPEHPEQRFDVYISLKREGDKLWFDEMLFVKTDKADTLRKTDKADKPAAPAKRSRKRK